MKLGSVTLFKPFARSSSSENRSQRFKEFKENFQEALDSTKARVSKHLNHRREIQKYAMKARFSRDCDELRNYGMKANELARENPDAAEASRLYRVSQECFASAATRLGANLTQEEVDTLADEMHSLGRPGKIFTVGASGKYALGFARSQTSRGGRAPSEYLTAFVAGLGTATDFAAWKNQENAKDVPRLTRTLSNSRSVNTEIQRLATIDLQTLCETRLNILKEFGLSLQKESFQAHYNQLIRDMNVPAMQIWAPQFLNQARGLLGEILEKKNEQIFLRELESLESTAILKDASTVGIKKQQLLNTVRVYYTACNERDLGVHFSSRIKQIKPRPDTFFARMSAAIAEATETIPAL